MELIIDNKKINLETISKEKILKILINVMVKVIKTLEKYKFASSGIDRSKYTSKDLLNELNEKHETKIRYKIFYKIDIENMLLCESDIKMAYENLLNEYCKYLFKLIYIKSKPVYLDYPNFDKINKSYEKYDIALFKIFLSDIFFSELTLDEKTFLSKIFELKEYNLISLTIKKSNMSWQADNFKIDSFDTEKEFKSFLKSLNEKVFKEKEEEKIIRQQILDLKSKLGSAKNTYYYAHFK